MGFGIRLEVWGDFAAFNRPEMKVERVSYDVMTPSAARGILEAIYWKPQMRWVIDEIHVLAPIRFGHIRRNEVSGRISVAGANGVVKAMQADAGTLGVNVQDERQQRAALVLRDVRYGICAHVEVLDPDGLDVPEAKHLEMFKRRAGKGQYFHHPYLGVREFPAHFALVEEFSAPPPGMVGEQDLGWMLHDFVYSDDPDGRVVESNGGRRLTADPRFFRAVLRDGVMSVPDLMSTRR